jgi:hypothetical protein
MLPAINNAHPALTDPLANPVIADDCSGRQLEPPKVRTLDSKVKADSSACRTPPGL